MRTVPTSNPDWWRSSTVYQIYPRSFADSNGDGVGDLEGIRAHLDHLAWLGVDAIWLSPIFVSPMADFGYDVADYCAIDPLFGDLDTFDRLLEDVHGHGMRLLLDWVPNHTSDQHPWFLDARSSRDAPRRDWYIWRDAAPDGGVPNNWTASLEDGPAWTFDEATGQYYLHLFLPAQPDLNWANPEVESAMHDTLRFWLDRGVDGFRADVVQCIGKTPELEDDPPELVGLPRCILHDVEDTHRLLRRVRGVLDSYGHHPMIVGELALLDPALVGKYLGDQLHTAFNFAPIHTLWDATAWRDVVGRSEEAMADDWPAWVLSNHDVPRFRTRVNEGLHAVLDATGTEERARAGAVLLLTLRGIPFLYQGEELGLTDATVTGAAIRDPGGRDGCRAPIPWTAEPGHGWTDPWLPFAPEATTNDVATMVADPTSIVHLYRRLLDVRSSSAALSTGTFTFIDTPEGVLGFRRQADDEELVVLVNMSDHEVTGVAGSGTVVIDSLPAQREPVPFSGVLAARQAVVLTST